MTRSTVIALLALFATGLLAGCADGSEAASESGDLVVAEAFTPVPPNPEVAGVYLVIENGSGVDDHLIGASTDIAGAVEIHSTTEDDAGRSIMEEQERLAVPAGSTVTFEPGGLHLMLLQVSEPLQVDDTFDLELEFAEAGPMQVEVTVVSLDALVSGDDGQIDEHHDHDMSGNEEEP